MSMWMWMWLQMRMRMRQLVFAHLDNERVKIYRYFGQNLAEYKPLRLGPRNWAWPATFRAFSYLEAAALLAAAALAAHKSAMRSNQVAGPRLTRMWLCECPRSCYQKAGGTAEMVLKTAEICLNADACSCSTTIPSDFISG